MDATPKKVAILGGGASALTVAWALTSQPDWRRRYASITVYQQGWRLGGKGASGRGPDGRIEEHGLHVWMGWYQNAFRIMREAYAELGRTAGAPLANWDDAFKRHGFIDLGEQVNGRWIDWPLEFPITDDAPGQGGEFGTLADYIDETLQSLHRLLDGTLFTAPTSSTAPAQGLIDKLLQSVEHALHLVEDVADIAAAELLLHAARGHSARLRQGAEPDEVRGPLVALLREVRRRLLAHIEAVSRATPRRAGCSSSSTSGSPAPRACWNAGWSRARTRSTRSTTWTSAPSCARAGRSNRASSPRWCARSTTCCSPTATATRTTSASQPGSRCASSSAWC